MKMIWIEVLVSGVIMGFFVAFLLSLIVKWNIHHRVQRKTGIKFCMFCLAFWLSLWCSIVFVTIDGLGGLAFEYIFIVPVSTMIGINVKLPSWD